MRRLFLLFPLLIVFSLLIVSLLIVAVPAQARALRFPDSGRYAFRLDLPDGWAATADRRGGLLLVPPNTHALIYLAIISNNKLRGHPASAVVRQVSQVAGVVMDDKQEPERITTTDGTRIIRGTAYYGTLPAKHGLKRRARIVLFKLSPDTFAQVWTVTQPGMNANETRALEDVLNGVTLTAR
jgi:hypothetical protein